MKTLTIELNLTNRCNFNCSYCFEKQEAFCAKDEWQTKESFADVVNKILKSTIDNPKFYENGFSHVFFNLWGGEPTLRIDLIKLINEITFNLKNVTIGVVTNGSNVDDLIVIAKQNQETGKEFSIQISYDGNPIHDEFRKTGTKPTSEIIKKSIQKLYDNKIVFSLKSTIPHESFGDIYDAYLDIVGLREIYPFGGIVYAPTIDYFNDINDSENSLTIFQDQILKILKHEINTKCNVFAPFFVNNKIHCATGKTMLFCDIDGKIYKCHGASYNIYKNDHCLSNIYESEWFDKFIVESYEHTKYESESIVPEFCIDCFSNHCLICNVKMYEKSKKNTYHERFVDFSGFGQLCEYYKTISKASIIYNKLKKGE